LNQTYRWNQAEHAAGYDAAAEHIHPHYLEMQEKILLLLARMAPGACLLVDLGGGSGRLVEKFLDRFPQAAAVVVDQSQPFLDLALARLERFGCRASCVLSRLQDDWPARLPPQCDAIVSMSAIHHLSGPEKKQLYARCCHALRPGGVLLNGDEIRDADDRVYKRELENWADHIFAAVAEGRIGPRMRPMLEKWKDRTVIHCDQPRASGDDCHETIDAQLGYLRAASFREAGVAWQKQMWSVLEGVK
jgi:tRNA (cmo5U34)-methyltransferase